MVIRDQFIKFARANFGDPVGVCDKRATHGDHVEFIGFHARDQIVDACNFGFAAAVSRNKFLSQTHAANADSWLTGNLFYPASQVEVRAFEFGFPETTSAAVEYVDACVGKRLNKLLKFFEARRETRSKVLLLPLREPQNDRIIIADLGANTLHNIGGETRALNERSTVLIVTLVRTFPKKVIDEVAMCAVKLECIEA